MKAETLNEAELDLEVRALREGEGRLGSSASQSYMRFNKAAVCTLPRRTQQGIRRAVSTSSSDASTPCAFEGSGERIE